MEYLIVGDVHGDTAFARKMCKLAQANDITTIIQVGDFGIWDHTSWGVEFLDRLSRASEEAGVQWVFVPGNHENYDRLEYYEASNYRTHEGFVKIRDNIFYTGKVHAWEWEGVMFKAVGGAYSIDKNSRTPLESWWPQEQLTDHEFDKVVQIGKADVLLTHDCPTYAPFSRLWPSPESHMHRQRIDEVVKYTQAGVHFHGHMHDWYDYENFFGGRIIGLDCNTMASPNESPKNHVILSVFKDGDGIWYDLNTKPYFKSASYSE